MTKKYRKIKTIVEKPLKELKKENVHLSIDNLDKEILKLLIWDARLSYREIARQLKLSVGTVIDRLKKLQVSRVITGYSANVDIKKLGYDITAIIELIAPKLNLKKSLEKLTAMHNVNAIYHTTGDIDIIIIAKFKTIDEINSFLERLYNEVEIIRSETRIVFDTIKEDFRTLIS